MRTHQATSPGDGHLEPIDEAREADFRNANPSLDASGLNRTLIYPNRWQEDRNLRSLHKEQYHGAIKATVQNQKYLDVSNLMIILVID